MTTRVAVIPARGGSRRVPRKNIKAFHGKPMIAWPIAAAQDSGCFDRVVVSTDDDEIASVARAAGAEVPFRRPSELADDFAGTREVIAHAADQLKLGDNDGVCCIYATAPFLQASDLVTGWSVLKSSNAPYAFSVAAFEAPIQRAIRIDTSGVATMFDPGAFTARSQDLEAAFHDAAQFYWGWASSWRSTTPIFQGGRVVVLPRSRVQDVDTSEDWAHAERLFALLMREASR